MSYNHSHPPHPNRIPQVSSLARCSFVLCSLVRRSIPTTPPATTTGAGVATFVSDQIMDENHTNVVDCETSLKLKKPKFKWDNRTLMVFVDLCLIELRKCHRPGEHEKEWKLYEWLLRLETGLGGTRSLIEASLEWWEEKIKENKDYAKFRDTDLSIFDEKYALLFRDSVAIGDQTMTPLQFQNNSNLNEENMEGKRDSDEINLDDDEPLFPSFPKSSSTKRKKKMSFSNNRSTKSKSSVYEEKVDALLEAISTKSTQTFPQNNPSPTIPDCMAIVIKFPKFREGTKEFSQALATFTKKENHDAFMFPMTDEAKIEFLKMASDDNDESWLEEDREFKMLCGLDLKGIILGCNVPRPCHTSDCTGHMFINEDCIGAIDGTHVRRQFHKKRKQNKNYVVDVRYPNTRGYLAPYKGTNILYHILDFRRGHTAAIREPRGPKEKFNYLHSSLRNIIERTFGVWKARWALLRDMHVNYKYMNQVRIVIASMVIYNYIRKFGRFDEAFNRAQEESYNPTRDDSNSEVYEEGPSTRRTSDDDLYMAATRDIIAKDIITLRR
uniref:DDE Tnp4 domain-containing protein n=1 Tax=Lactuca sativa TaxID=4236 RepID=A0A9R1WHD7_LACSA|nr:hypothetical protein LSAT_V11C200058550 [Lactuca sativa]